MTKHKKNAYLQEFIPELWHSLKEGYGFSLFRRDLFAGITVGIVALPLAMAFAIASGVPPERGLFTAIIAGFLISFFGGSKVQIGGPTGAFVVIVYDIVQRVGYEGLIVATLMAGALLFLMAISRLGSLMKFVPYPLVTGFTSGIAVIIFSSQMKDFFGLKPLVEPSHFLAKWHTFYEVRHTWSPTACTVALSTLAIILLVKRFAPRLPWGILSVVLVSVGCYFFSIPVDTIASRFGEIPTSLPKPSLEGWHFSLTQVSMLMPDAITIALLAAIESLLSAVVADGMTGGRHKSNVELLAQSFANIGSSLFGGIPATGAIARTATNVKSGGCSPIAGIIHAAALFCILRFFSPFVSMIPLPALAALLVMVAWNMGEWHQFKHLFRAPKGDIMVLLSAFLLTVFVDLTVAVEVGMVMAAFVFVKRMSALAHIEAMAPTHSELEGLAKTSIPPHVELYEIQGPFFFGVVDKLQEELRNLEKNPKVFILLLKEVNIIDASGLHALKELCLQFQKHKTQVILADVKGKPSHSIHRYGIDKLIGTKNVVPTLHDALMLSKTYI